VGKWVTLVAKGSMTKLSSILRTNADLEFYVGGSAPCSKSIGGGPIKWLLLRKRV
jgi:hypothetical protein